MKKGRKSKVDYVPVVIIMGQSNAAGRALASRLDNTLFNYKGISTGYPSQRVSQVQYSKTPPGVYTYWKSGSDPDLNWNTEVLSWTAYDAATTGRLALSEAGFFGLDLSLATQIQEATGRDTFIIKPAFGGTSLIPGATTNRPGTWNHEIKYYAASIISAAIRDLKTFRPGKLPRLLGVVWYQGENDTYVASSTYNSNFTEFRNFMDAEIRKNFLIERQYRWHLVKLNFYKNTAENNFNSNIDTIVSSGQNMTSVSVSAYPRRMDLSSTEDDPITKGSYVAGGDDEHLSYIGMLALGELLYNQMTTML